MKLVSIFLWRRFFRRCCLGLSTLGLSTLPMLAYGNSLYNTPRVLVLDWSSQQVMSYIAGQLIETQKIPVEYVQARSEQQWDLLTAHGADIQVEVWEGTMAEAFNFFVSRHSIIDAGLHDAKTREEWWYPSYVKELCPGLPSWKSLKECASLFATKETSPKGRYMTGPWGTQDHVRIRALGLNFSLVEYPNGDALNRELKKAIAKRQPIVIYNWTPNWVGHVYDGEFVEFPEYKPECETNPYWGYNKRSLWDCGNPKNGWLKKATSTRLATISPCASAIIKAMNFQEHDIAELASLVDYQGMTAKAAAVYWLNANPTVWQPWLAQSECKKTN